MKTNTVWSQKDWEIVLSKVYQLSGSFGEHNAKRIQCDSCMSVLEYLPEDEHEESTNYGRSDRYIICPICKNEIYTLIY